MRASLVALSANKGQIQKRRLLLFFILERIKTNAMAKGWKILNLAVIPHFLLYYKIINTISSLRSSRPEDFFKKSVLRKFAEFLGNKPVPESLL